MNEPSLTDPNFDASRKVARGTTLRAWVREMAQWYRAQGVKQLVFVGDVRGSGLCMQLRSTTHQPQGGERVDAQAGIPNSWFNTGAWIWSL